MSTTEKFDEATSKRMREMVNVLWSELAHVPPLERSTIAADLLAKCIAALAEKHGAITTIEVILPIIFAGIELQTKTEIVKCERKR